MAKRQGPVETVEYAAMLGRMIRAYGKRADLGMDPADLADMARLSKQLDDMMAEVVRTMRARGESWAYIGSGLGITRQAAFQRWGRVAA